jgi:hypothetical protein
VGRNIARRADERGSLSSGVAQWWECIDSDRKSPGEECTESNRFECRALKEGAADDLVLSKSQTFIARRENLSAQASGPAERLYRQASLPLTDRPRGRI